MDVEALVIAAPSRTMLDTAGCDRSESKRAFDKLAHTAKRRSAMHWQKRLQVNPMGSEAKRDCILLHEPYIGNVLDY